MARWSRDKLVYALLHIRTSRRSMALQNVVLIYNKYLLQFLNSLKNVDNVAREQVRSVLKTAGVLAIDHESSEYISMSPGDLQTDDCILPGVALSALVAGVTGGSHIANAFIALLDVLSVTFHAKDEVLATQVLRAISAIQSGSLDAKEQLSAIFHEDVHAKLRQLMAVTHNLLNPRDEKGMKDGEQGSGESEKGKESETQKDGEKDVDDAGSEFMDALAGSSIATVAKEIADELVESELLKDFDTDPSKLDFASLLDPNSKLGSVAKLVTSKLHDQLGSGKLDQGKLMTEVMSMFGKLNTGGGAANSNPLLAQVMSMAGQMGGKGNASQKVRSRLQNKLSKR